jgi:hypothetical protein
VEKEPGEDLDWIAFSMLFYGLRCKNQGQRCNVLYFRGPLCKLYSTADELNAAIGVIRDPYSRSKKKIDSTLYPPTSVANIFGN